MACFGDFADGLEILQTAAGHEPLSATTFSEIGLLEAAKGDADASAAAYDRARELNPAGPWLGGLGGVPGATRPGATPPPLQGSDPAAAGPLPGASETDPPATVIETGVDVTSGGNPPPTIIAGAITTGPDGTATVQFSAIDGRTGRRLEALVTPQGSITTPAGVTAVPEPASLLLLLGGGMVGGGSRWLQRRAARAV
jgi:hypothetical protein